MDFVPSERLRSRLAPLPSSHKPNHNLPVPVFISVKRRKRIRQFACCEFDGFHALETSPQACYLWTTGRATIECQFPESAALQYVWLEIASTAPHGSLVTLQWDEQVVATTTVRGRATIRGRLAAMQVVNGAKLNIVSDTFVPQQLNFGDDARELGVAVRGLVFGKRRTKYRARLAFQRSMADRFVRWLSPGKSAKAA